MSEAITATAGTGTSAPNLTEGTDDQAAAQATADQSQTTNVANDNQEKTFTQADINRILARETKKAIENFQAQQQRQAQEAEMTEAQKEKQRADEAERKAQEAEQRVANLAIRNAVTLAVADTKLGARDPKAMALLVNSSALEVDGDTVKGIDAELKRIRTEHPALFFSTTVDGAQQGEPGGAVDMNALIRNKARK